MNKIVRRILIFLVIIALASIVLYFYMKKNSVDLVKSNEEVIYIDKPIIDEKIAKLSAWVVYWDINVDEEIKVLDKELRELCYFGAYFDQNNELIIPEKLIDYYNKSRKVNVNNYITIVNDKVNSDGSSSLKDIEILNIVLKDQNSRSEHIKKIIDLVKKYGFNGIEIDYERIGKDIELWNEYLLFIDELYKETEKEGLELRIVLEPNTPFEKLDFIHGPTYVMMCYNLYGGFSEAGEKANPKFIKELIDKMVKVPGNKNFAIATGGFNWDSNGKVTSILEIDAKKLVEKYKLKENRDIESQCLTFNYTDEDNVKHEVWYSDKTTLELWMKVIYEAGYDVSIWRLGGNLF